MNSNCMLHYSFEKCDLMNARAGRQANDCPLWIFIIIIIFIPMNAYTFVIQIKVDILVLVYDNREIFDWFEWKEIEKDEKKILNQLSMLHSLWRVRIQKEINWFSLLCLIYSNWIGTHAHSMLAHTRTLSIDELYTFTNTE